MNPEGLDYCIGREVGFHTDQVQECIGRCWTEKSLTSGYQSLVSAVSAVSAVFAVSVAHLVETEVAGPAEVP